MSRYVRNTAILLQIEPSYAATPVVPFEPTDAVLIKDATFKIDRDVVPRDLKRSYFGGSEHLIGTRRSEIDCTVEIAGSGAAGTPPSWGKLLRIAGMAEVITSAAAPTDRVEYSPVTTGQESARVFYFIDGVRYVMKGVRANAMLEMDAYGIPLMKLKLMGFDTQAVASAMPVVDFAAWQRPLVITDANSGDIRLGCTYTAGAIGGGTVLPSRGLSIDLGNKLSHVKLLAGEAIDITDRDTKGSCSVFLTADQEVTWRDEVNANTLTTLGFNIGAAVGQRVGIFGAAVQRIDPQPEVYEGRAMVKTELRFLPSGDGNNDLRIVVR